MKKTTLRSLAVGAVFAVVTASVSALGRLTMRGKGRPDGRWFRALAKPRFQPPNWVFGPVWIALYASIAYSGWRIWRRPSSPSRTRALRLWAAQLALNGAWTPIFFGARKPTLALADLAALDVAAGAFTVEAAKLDRLAAATIVPYLGWLGFATALNGAIVVKNR